MKLRDIFETAKASGKSSEAMMWKSIDAMDDMLADLKKTNKQAFWDFMREQYGIASGGHYDKDWAHYDVAQMYSTDKDGKKHEGEMLSLAETEEHSKGWSMPSGTTKYDVYVAMNAMAHDLGKSFDKEHIAKATKCFYFSDEDWKHKESKIWCYMAMVYDND